MPQAILFVMTPLMLFWISYAAWCLMEIWIFSRDLKRAKGEKKDRGSVYFITVMITAGMFIAFLAPHLWPWAHIALPPVPLFDTAIAMTWIGILLRIWSVLTLGRHFRTSVRILEGHKLVTRGPYRVLRHPSYTGGLLAVSGIGLAFGNWISLAGVSGCTFLGYGLRILIEEAALRAHFGAEFEAHRKRTWAFIPFIW